MTFITIPNAIKTVLWAKIKCNSQKSQTGWRFIGGLFMAGDVRRVKTPSLMLNLNEKMRILVRDCFFLVTVV